MSNLCYWLKVILHNIFTMIAFVLKIMPVYSLCSLCFHCLCIAAFSARLNNSVVFNINIAHIYPVIM